MRKRSLALVLLLVVSACKQNPYPQAGALLSARPPEPAPLTPPLILDMNDKVEVYEGKPVEVALKPSVPSPGKSVVTVVGLPEGAKYDPEKQVISWIPGRQAANDPDDPRVMSRVYALKIQLRSSLDKLTFVQQSLFVTVKDTPGTFTLQGPGLVQNGTVVLKEGTNYSVNCVVSSEDFPTGPFEFSARNLPPGATITKGANPTEFSVSYTPSYRDVDLIEPIGGNPNVTTVTRAVEILATDPAGRTVKVPLQWLTQDVRMSPQISGPTEVAMGTDIYFTVRAEDLNGERLPRITLVPRAGDVLVKREDDAERTPISNPWSVFSFRIPTVPPEKLGTTEELLVRACVQKTVEDYSVCSDRRIKVRYERESVQPVPLIKRDNYLLGSTQYVRRGEKLTVPLAVVGQELPIPFLPSVKLLPQAISSEVQWGSGKLAIEGKTVGVKQFSVEATSIYGQKTLESFILEVLPESWSPVLVFGDSPLHAEATRTMALFAKSQFANAPLQLAEPKLLLLRKAAVLTSASFFPREIQDALERSVASLSQVAIFSPLVDGMSGALKEEVAALKVRFGSRVRGLADFRVKPDPGAALTAPKGELLLKTGLTSYSNEATPIDTSDVAEGVCKPILKIVSSVDATIEHVVAVQCKRANGGDLILSGLELASIELSAQDLELLKEWMTTLGLGVVN